MKTMPAVLVITSAPESVAAFGSAVAAALSACATSERTSETWYRGSKQRPSAQPAHSHAAARGAVSLLCWWGWSSGL